MLWRSRAEVARISTRGKAPEAEQGEEKDGVMGKQARRKVTKLGVS